ncbi:clavesin-1-like isoform X2 [Dermacentor andersoni]|uniref:clavesin-1-like isoform X2 n=1 Tax=Dermacentor andersoni TaxID=34620 RepID=UPI002415EB8A|nr:clavesin-1-like isoform X2 [Dermacentor andersoni]
MMDLHEAARLELGETPEIKAESLGRLCELIRETPSLDVPNDEKLLVMFLRVKKYRVEEAFKLFQNYVRVRRDVPDFFRDLTPANVPLRKICHENYLVMTSADGDALGRGVALLKLGAWNSTMCSFTDLIRGAMILASSCFYEDISQIYGVACIVDLEGLGFHHFKQLTPSLLIKLAHITQIHFVGEDVSKLWEICPREMVPAEFGGTREDFDYDRQEESVRRLTDLFEDLCRFDCPAQ